MTKEQKLELAKVAARALGALLLTLAGFLAGRSCPELREDMMRVLLREPESLAALLAGIVSILGGQMLHKKQTGGLLAPSSASKQRR